MTGMRIHFSPGQLVIMQKSKLTGNYAISDRGEKLVNTVCIVVKPLDVSVHDRWNDLCVMLPDGKISCWHWEFFYHVPPKGDSYMWREFLAKLSRCAI